MSIEMQNAMEKDMAAIHEDGSVDYVDNAPEPTPETNTAPPVIEVDPSTGEVVGDADPTAGFFGEN